MSPLPTPSPVLVTRRRAVASSMLPLRSLPPLLLLVLLSLLMALSACAASRRGDAVPRERSGVVSGVVSGLVTASQLDSATAGGSLLEALTRLRPDMLRPRGGSLRAPAGLRPAIFLDGAPIGDAAILATIPARSVGSVRYLRATEMGASVGRESPAGAILVTTRRDP